LPIESINEVERGRMSRNAKLTWSYKAVGITWGLALIFFTQIAWSTPTGYQVGNGKWLSGDFHQHTTLTDGSNSMPAVMSKENFYGLDWWANSEHGGAFSRDASTNFFDQQNHLPQFLGNPLPSDYLGQKSM
jgi:hypothetical protein